MARQPGRRGNHRTICGGAEVLPKEVTGRVPREPVRDSFPALVDAWRRTSGPTGRHGKGAENKAARAAASGVERLSRSTLRGAGMEGRESECYS